MADFVLKNNFCFEFNSKFFQQTSGTGIGTNFGSSHENQEWENKHRPLL